MMKLYGDDPLNLRPKPSYDKSAPNLVSDVQGFVIGYAQKWNPVGIGEVIVWFFDGSADSMVASEIGFPNGREKAYDWLNKREP